MRVSRSHTRLCVLLGVADELPYMLLSSTLSPLPLLLLLLLLSVHSLTCLRAHTIQSHKQPITALKNTP